MEYLITKMTLAMLDSEKGKLVYQILSDTKKTLGSKFLNTFKPMEESRKMQHNKKQCSFKFQDLTLEDIINKDTELRSLVSQLTGDRASALGNYIKEIENILSVFLQLHASRTVLCNRNKKSLIQNNSSYKTVTLYAGSSADKLKDIGLGNGVVIESENTNSTNFIQTNSETHSASNAMTGKSLNCINRLNSPPHNLQLKVDSTSEEVKHDLPWDITLRQSVGSEEILTADSTKRKCTNNRRRTPKKRKLNDVALDVNKTKIGNIHSELFNFNENKKKSEKTKPQLNKEFKETLVLTYSKEKMIFNKESTVEDCSH